MMGKVLNIHVGEGLWCFAMYEEYQTKTEAMQAEYRFKQLSRGAKEKDRTNGRNR